MKYLIVGDGNFSFSLSLAGKLDPGIDQMVATSFESHEEVVARPQAAENVSILQTNPVVAKVLHEVDATQLEKCHHLNLIGYQYDRIIFNFPHTGGKSKIQQNQALLKAFFISAASSFLKRDGQIDVSLCKGQGGTPVDCVLRGYNNTWKVVEMATEGGLILSAVEPFSLEEYPGYVPTGYRGHTDKGFLLEGALRHVFNFPGFSESLYPPSYIHDVSFWYTVTDSVFDETKLKEIVVKVCENCVQSVECINIYHQPSNPELEQPVRISYCYRLAYCSKSSVLCRSQARDLQLKLRDVLQEDMGVDVR